MENSPSNSLEKQIDNFLEHFKRSASKAMDADWCSVGGNSTSAAGTNAAINQPTNMVNGGAQTPPPQPAQPAQEQQEQPLEESTARSSSLEVAELSDTSLSAATMPSTQADSDALLFSTLCDIDKHNYLYLFERCKACNVNARQLRYFERDHIRDLIPTSHLGVLAEFEYLLHDWKLRNGFARVKREASDAAPPAGEPPLPKIMLDCGTMTTPIYTESRGSNTEAFELASCALPTSSETTYIIDEHLTHNMHPSLKYDEESQGSAASPSSWSDRESDKYQLTAIIPTVLAKCKQKYKANRGLLTEVERRLLSSAIIDFFISRKIHVKAHMINNFAEQIAQHFPTESKRAWYDRKNCKGRGRLYVKLYNSHRRDKLCVGKKRKSDSTTADAAFPVQDIIVEFDEDALQIQNWLKCNKCEDMDEVMTMWKDSLNYRRAQLRRIQQGSVDSVVDVLDNWPSYKWPQGHMLLAIDFNNMHPLSEATFRHRWNVYMTNIITLMEVELKDGASVDLFRQFKVAQSVLNDDSSQCTLINLLHAIMKPSRCFSTPQGVRRFCITESQNSFMRLVVHASEMEPYNESHPCIFVVGDSLLNVEDCYVAFRDIRYRLKFSEALAASMHFYAVLKLEYPLPTLNFWQFIRGYFFEIHLENETPYAVMDNVVKYLDTCDMIA